jgi:zinc transporter 9
MSSSAGIKPVVAALAGNTFVFVIKCIAAVVSGSSALFSEAVHSFADTANQLLLFIGIRRSNKKADQDFAYGYGNERFFWALLSACSIFFIGAGVTIYEGIHTLYEGGPVTFKPIVFLVLLISGMVEINTFVVAARELKRQFPDTTLRERLREGDPATLAVYLEDGVAVCGLVIASIEGWQTRGAGFARRWRTPRGNWPGPGRNWNATTKCRRNWTC